MHAVSVMRIVAVSASVRQSHARPGVTVQVAAFQERVAVLLTQSVHPSGLNLPEVDAAVLENMTVMGFDHDRSHCALLCAHNDVGGAIQWLHDHTSESLVQLQDHAQHAVAGNTKIRAACCNRQRSLCRTFRLNHCFGFLSVTLDSDALDK